MRAAVNLPIISYVTRRLINGHKDEFTKRIGRELGVAVTAKQSLSPLIGIEGDSVNVGIAEGVIRELDQKAQIIADRNGLKNTRDVRNEHWNHIGVDLTKLLENARAELLRQTGMLPVILNANAPIEKHAIVPQNDDKRPAPAIDPKFFDQPQPSRPASQTNAAFTQATTVAAPETSSVAKKQPTKAHLIKVLEDKFQPRNISQALGYLATLDSVPGEHRAKTFVNSYIYEGGPAGGGKTYGALRAAVDAIRQGLADQIIVIRPPTTAGKDPGAMPGNAKKKAEPYVAGGIASNLEKITGMTMADLEAKKLIRAFTPDFERGETYGTPESPVVVIIDEPQNLTIQQIELLATRLGEGSIMIFCGDIGGKQNDLKNQVPGLAHLIATQGSGKMTNPALDRATAFIKFTEEDSSARNKILPHVLKALSNPPDDYAALMTVFNALGVNAAVADAIEKIRLYAVDVLDKAAKKTIDHYGKRLENTYPYLFEQEPAKVVPIRAATRHLQSS